MCHADRRHAVVRALQVGAHGQHLFEGVDGLDVLEVLRWTPEDPRSRQMRFWKIGRERQRAAAVVLGPLNQVFCGSK